MSEAEKFTLSLIEEVKKRPVLYDTSNDVGIKGNAEKNTAWAEIAALLGEHDSTVKNRWKGLKECYVKYKKARSETFFNPIYDQYKNWRWASHLEFMEPHMKGVRNANVEENPQFNETFECPDEGPNLEEALDIFEEYINNDESFSLLDTTDYFTQLNDIPQMTNDTTEQIDDIHYLFMSYAETFRKFSAKKQAILKLDLARLFSNAELNNFELIETYQAPIFSLGDPIGF